MFCKANVYVKPLSNHKILKFFLLKTFENQLEIEQLKIYFQEPYIFINLFVDKFEPF